MDEDNIFDVFNGQYELRRKNKKFRFRAENTTLFPTKMSSSNFIQLYALYLLDKRDKMYGKEILNSIKSVVNEEVWKPSHGTLYPLLQILENDGYVEVSDVEEFELDRDKRIKKYYKITEAGRQELEHRLDEFKNKLKGSSMFFSKIVKDFYK